MKFKLAVIAAMAAVAAGCAEREHVERPDDGSSAIRFSTLVPTRAAAINTPALMAAAGGFDVWAYSHAGNWSANPVRTGLLEEVTVTSADNGATWTYASPVEWPLTDNVSFFAYSPAGGAEEITFDNSVPVVKYLVAPTAAQQQDLLIADNLYDQQGNDYFPADRNVNLQFRHALSQISFSACYTGTKATHVGVTQITLRNVYSEGRAALTNPISWTVEKNSPADYTLQRGTNGLLSVNNLSALPTEITAARGMLYLMPQDITRAEDQMSMDVTFDIDGSPFTYNVPIAAPEAWLAGKSYKYQIILEDEALHLILIDTGSTLENWDVHIMIQPVPLSENPVRNQIRLNSALKSLGELRNEAVNGVSVDECKYYALYLKNIVTHDITIDMAAYTGYFREGDVVMFDAKKIVERWNYTGEEESRVYYKFEVEYDGNDWELIDAAQPYPTLDALTYATTNTAENPTAPSKYIQNKGSIILLRK